MTTQDLDPRATESMESRARHYVRELRGFYRLLATAGLVIALTFTINLISSPGRWWFLWVVFGMGIAVAFKGVKLALDGRFLGPDWEARKMREYAERDRA